MQQALATPPIAETGLTGMPMPFGIDPQTPKETHCARELNSHLIFIADKDSIPTLMRSLNKRLNEHCPSCEIEEGACVVKHAIMQTVTLYEKLGQTSNFFLRKAQKRV